MLAAIERKEPFSFDYRLWHVTGQYRWCHDSGQPQFSSGQLAGYVGSITDIHQRKLAEDELKAADQRKNEFLATLRTSCAILWPRSATRCTS